MKFDNLTKTLGEFGINISNAEIAINWVQLTVVLFSLLALGLMMRVVWKECDTKVKVLAGFCTVSVLLVKCNELLGKFFKSEELLQYSSYVLCVSLCVTIGMVICYKLYGNANIKTPKTNKVVKKKTEPKKDLGLDDLPMNLDGMSKSEDDDLTLDDLNLDLGV